MLEHTAAGLRATGADVFDLGTGIGASTSAGGPGDDVYYVHSGDDRMVENAGKGSDTVLVDGSWSWTLGANVENLVASARAANLALACNALANVVAGGPGNDALNGGAGAETLTGGAGNDVFSPVAKEANGDTVSDFNGAGAGPGDRLVFSGYGAAAQGAHLVKVNATDRQVVSSDGLITDAVHFANQAGLDRSDYAYV